MDGGEQGAALVLQALGLDVDHLNVFENRKILQKAMYLLQECPSRWGFGFSFNLYIRGPYSPDLADAGYRLLRDRYLWASAITSATLTEGCIADVETMRRLFSTGAGQLDADLLELAATLHFLVQYTFAYESSVPTRVESARQWIVQRKFHLASRFGEARAKLAQLGMLPMQ
jgi:hypothetical protein